MNFPKYTIRRSKDYNFFWVLYSTNGNALITSETYLTKEACMNGIKSSKENVLDKNFERRTSISYQYYFNQRANNYQVLGTSEMYSSSQACNNGIEAVKREAPIANVEDLT